MITYSATEPNAFYAALETERPRIVRLCGYLIGDTSAAEDVAQEVLIEAWRHIENLNDPQALRAWLSGIARNVSARWLRKKGRGGFVWDTVLDDSDTTLQATTDDDVLLDLEHQDLAVLLDRAMELLPPDTRAVLVQKYLEEASYEEIATRLGLSENVTAVRLHRGRVALRKVLTTDFVDEAASMGLFNPDETWQTTRIWCTGCGNRYLLGQFTTEHFKLRCPVCDDEPNAYHSQSKSTTFLKGIRAFRPALTRFTAWMDSYFRAAIAQGEAICRSCGRITPLRHGFPYYAPPSYHSQRGIHVLCDACGAGSYESLDGLGLSLPEGREFFKKHPRIRTLQQVEVEHNGVPALVTRFEAINDPATFAVILNRDTYEVLEIAGAYHE